MNISINAVFRKDRLNNQNAAPVHLRLTQNRKLKHISAIKAKRFLNSQGYSCEIKRAANVSENGCTHMILVNADSKIVIALLNKHHIEHGKLLGEGMS